jgi:hypothetical protein
VHLEPKAIKKLSKVGDLQEVEIHEYGHGHETFPTIDTVVRDPPALFNMTVNHTKQQGLNDSSLRNVFTYLPEDIFPHPCHYYWVILPKWGIREAINYWDE